MKNRKFYYWIIACTAILEMGIYGGLINNINALFVIPVSEGLGISRGTFSLALSTRSVVAILSTLFAGTFLKKFGYRKSVTVSLLVAAAGFALFALSRDVSLLVLGAIMVGAAEGVCAAGGVSRLVVNWFHKHHGLILGMVTAATGLGGSLFSVLLTAVIGAYSWRIAYVVSSGCLLLVTVIVMLLVKNRPEEIGLGPYGEGTNIKHKQRATQDHWHGFSFAELKKKASFYVFLVITFLSSLCLYVALPVVVPYYQDIGMSKETAAQIYGVLMLMLSAGKLLFGYFTDKLGAKKVTLFCLILMIVSMILLFTVESVFGGYVAAIVLALALPLVGVTIPLLVPALYGYGSGSNSVGIALAMIPAAGMLGGVLANSLFDAIGSYRPILFVNIFAAIVITAFYMILFAWTGKDRKKLEEKENV